MSVLTVSQLNRYVSFKLKNDSKLRNILIEGEISNLKFHSPSQSYYFSLIDGICRVNACLFSRYTSMKNFNLKNGSTVVVLCDVELYDKYGSYQIIVKDVFEKGIGKKKNDIDALKIKLQNKGYFNPEFKKPIPKFPKKIAVVTSASGAAVKDIIKVLSVRYPIAEVYIFDSLVQGEYAEKSICDKLIKADNFGADVVILSRGGGSEDDLGIFNSEKIADTIFSMKTPLVSAVGHEQDYTIADFTADMRAPTPTAAAQEVCVSLDSINLLLNNFSESLNKNIVSTVNKYKINLFTAEKNLDRYNPQNILHEKSQMLSNLEKNLTNLMNSCIEKRRRLLSEYEQKIKTSDIEKTLTKGYVLIYKDKNVVTDISVLEKGSRISIVSQDGKHRTAIIED